jgi:hypothetical protein
MNRLANIAAGLLAAAVLTANASARPSIAPADEYFGHMKMSILEIGNRLHDLARRTAGPQPAGIVHDATLAEDAIRDWERKYPADPWLAKDVASLVRIYAQLHTPDAQRHLRTSTSWLQKRYARYHEILAHDITH